MKIFKTILVALGSLLAGGAVVAVLALAGVIPGVGGETIDRNSQVIESVTKEEQVVLVSLGIQGIKSREAESQSFFGLFNVPGTDRATFIQYEFDAKLGIDGKDVTIAQTGENSYTVTIPAFIFIGHDDVTFTPVVERNGVLSWAAPQIETLDMVNEILNDETEQEYVDKHTDVLKEQAKSFYSNIIRSVDPAVELTFEFTE